ncbi:MAG: ATP-dependent transcriptional regulator, partial [Pseudomonadota bacterium]
AFSLYALGRLTLGVEPELALASFLQAGTIYRSEEETALQAAHIAMQLSAFALSAGQAEVAIDIVDNSTRAVARAENAALLSTLLMVKAEALTALGRRDEAREVRNDSLGWARYGFGSDDEVRARQREIAALYPTPDPDAPI